MGKITTYFSTADETFFRRIHRELSAHQDIKLLTGPANEPRTLKLMKEWRPDVGLLDASAFGANITHLTAKIHSCSPATKLVMFYPQYDDAKLIDSLKQGVNGFLSVDINRHELLRAIYAVHAGEFWAPRKTMARAFTQLLESKRESQDDASLRGQLSERECEIVEWMRFGMSNKEIGRMLGISDMTVKTHAHNIFHKLEVSGRVRLLSTIRSSAASTPIARSIRIPKRRATAEVITKPELAA